MPVCGGGGGAGEGRWGGGLPSLVFVLTDYGKREKFLRKFHDVYSKIQRKVKLIQRGGLLAVYLFVRLSVCL